MNNRRIILSSLALIMLFFFSLSAVAQEKETCALTKDSTATIDVNKLANTLIKRIKLSGYAQGGYTYDSKQSPNNEFKIYRIIFMANATVNRHINAFFMFDFNTGSLHELYFNYKFSPALNVRVGQFKTPFSIENCLSPTVLELTYPSSLATTYMICGGSQLMMPGGAGRDGGLNVYGTLLKGAVDYSVAVMNGTGRNKGDSNSQKDFVASISVHPAKWLTFNTSMILGTGNTTVAVSKDDASVYTAAAAPGVTGFKVNGNFKRNRYSAGMCVDTKSVGLRSEYMRAEDADSHSDGYYATGRLKNVFRNFDTVLSYDYLKTFADKQQRYTAGVQYWFYPQCRFQVCYSYKKSDSLGGENILMTQLQLRF